MLAILCFLILLVIFCPGWLLALAVMLVIALKTLGLFTKETNINPMGRGGGQR